MDVIVVYVSLLVGAVIAFLLYATSKYVEDQELNSGDVPIYAGTLIVLSLLAVGLAQGGVAQFLWQVGLPGAYGTALFLGPLFIYAVYLLGWHSGRDSMPSDRRQRGPTVGE